MSHNYLSTIAEKLNAEPIIQILSSRECFDNCSFCSVRNFMNKSKAPYLERSISNAIDEIEYLYKKYGIRRILFEDDNFFSRKNIKTKMFAKELAKRNIYDLNV